MMHIRGNIKNKYRVFCLLIIVAIFSIVTEVSAKEATFEVTVDRTSLSLGISTQLRLTFYDTQNIAAPELAQHDGLELRYVGPSTMMSFVNGRMSSSISHLYTVIPLKEGSYTLGPFTFEHKGTTYTSNKIQLTVSAPQKSPVPQGAAPLSQQSRLSQSQQESLEDYLFLTIEPTKEEAYVNELIPLTIKLYISQFSVRDIQYPEFSHEGFSVEDFEKPKQYQHVINGMRYEILEFNTTVFATRSGQLTLGPAELECSLLSQRKSRRRRTSSLFDDFFGDSLFDDFFGSYERHPITVRSPELTISVRALPEEGKPDNFKGTLGRFSFSLTAEPHELKVGDPITLKMIISGEGNFNTISVPELTAQEGFKIYDPQVKQNGNKKRFEQIIMPTTDQVKEIPKVSFSYFDVEKGTYQTLSKGPIPITVTKPEKEESLKIIEMPEAVSKPIIKEQLGRDIIYIKETPGHFNKKGKFLYANSMYLALHSIPVVLLVFLSFFVKRKKRLETDVRYARRLRAPKKARKGIHDAERLLKEQKTEEFYNMVFKTLQEYLGDKFHLPSGGITINIVDQKLRKMEISEDKLNMLKGLFDECDVARYAPSSLGKEKMQNTVTSMKMVIDYLERMKL